MMFAEMATELHSQGLTVQGYLKGLYEKYVLGHCRIFPLVEHPQDTDISKWVALHDLNAGLTVRRPETVISFVQIPSRQTRSSKGFAISRNQCV